jgi:hypothetical protein
MNLPKAGDYIDIHTHAGKPFAGIFFLETLMAHEAKTPDDFPEQLVFIPGSSQKKITDNK